MSAAQPDVKALNCPNCGAPLSVRGLAHTVTVVCESCLSILDAKDPNLHVLQQFQAQQKVQPAIPLGTRGKWHDTTYEVIGFQIRTINVEGTEYSWAEYLLFNPYKGFRYLTEYDGHWNDVTVLRALPETPGTTMRPMARYDGVTYKHFQTARAQTTYVIGSFPWQVRVGEQVTAMDFIAPPRLLSAESTPDETVWSLGEYTAAKAIWQAFKLPGSPPPPRGVFANQPSPFEGRVKSAWGMCVLLLFGLIAMAIYVGIAAAQSEVFRGTYSFSPRSGGEASFVTNTFELKGRPSDVELTLDTDLDNNWAYFNLALINVETGQAFDFGRDVSYYSGRDSDGAWSEGGRKDDVLIPTVPSGQYYLRVEPEMDANAMPVTYTIALKRDVPAASFFWIAALLLLIPPVIVSIRAGMFSQRRWAESDYAGGSE